MQELEMENQVFGPEFHHDMQQPDEDDMHFLDPMDSDRVY
jgi:hypothetical protein